MPLNGLGTYTAPTPEYPAIPNTIILASDFNAIIEDLEVALSLAIYKDGQASMAANLNLATFKIINLGTGTNPADATTVLQVFTNPTFTGTSGNGVTLAGTKASVTAAELNINSPTVSITGTTLDLISSNLGLTSTANLDIVSTTSTTLMAGTTLDETAITSITLTAPTITAVGSFVATLASTATAVTQAVGTNNTTVATTAFATALAFAAALPAQTGSAGKFITTDGATASWADIDKTAQYLFNISIGIS